MSSYYRQFAKRKDFLNILRELTKRVSKQEQVTNPLDTIKFQHYLRSNNDRLLLFTTVDNEVNAIVQNPSQKYYQLPFEPDGEKLRIWLRFVDYANNVSKDWSGFDNDATVIGGPNKQRGHTKYMDALAFDGVNTNYIRVPHKSPDTSMFDDGLQEGFGVSVWVRPTNLDLYGDKPRIIATKIDDSFADKGRGWSLWVDPDGTVVFVVRMNGTSYVRKATEAIKVPADWYHITAFFAYRADTSNTGGGHVSYGGFTETGFTSQGFTNQMTFVPTGVATTPIHVNGVEYTADPQSRNDRQPYFPVLSGNGLSILVGGTDEVGSGKWAGSIGDFRYFYNKVYTHAEALEQYQNKYTISDINHVALVGIANTIYEGPNTPPLAVGQTPALPPTPVSTPSTSAVSTSPISTTVDVEGTASGGGGGGAVLPSIPAQFYDPFSYIPPYTLITTNQISSDSKWRLSVAPGSGGFVRTEDFTIPNTATIQRVMRMKSGSDDIHPIITTNTARFFDVHARCLLRTVAQLSPETYNHAFFCFKYKDESNFYFVVLKTTGAELWKRIDGIDSLLGAQLNPSGSQLYPIHSQHQIDVRTTADGIQIVVWVDANADMTNAAIIWNATDYNPPTDGIISGLNPVGVRATQSDITIDNFLVRPIHGDSFQLNDPYTLTTVGQKSPNLKWELITPANGTDGTVRTYDHSSFETGGRVLNLDSGPDATQAPMVLSTASWAGLEVYCRMATLVRYGSVMDDRAELIFKWKDPNNYYSLFMHPSGWKIKRVISGLEDIMISQSTPTFDDNPAYPFHEVRVQVYNIGKSVVVYAGTPQIIRYQEHSAPGGMYLNDNNTLREPGRVGFRARNCNAVFDNVWIRMI